MMKAQKSKVLYSINVEDVQNVASEELQRKLTEDEIKFIEERLGTYIPWYEAISNALSDLNDQQTSMVV